MIEKANKEALAVLIDFVEPGALLEAAPNHHLPKIFYESVDVDGDGIKDLITTYPGPCIDSDGIIADHCPKITYFGPRDREDDL